MYTACDDALLSLTLRAPQAGGHGDTTLTNVQRKIARINGARLLGILAYAPSSPTNHKWRQAELALCRSDLLAQQQINPN
ncbi:hypothetical protein GCM10010909_37210 [Acidocella aquatica]|uniref:Uncharacterized protein n=1 Tax=Acidocella aquatica TaxID=1922313 RepID=A0ABQ6A997_9PROT|nr:hypothetical protein GCM10010909_37210 [Acidocella aquatica]